MINREPWGLIRLAGSFVFVVPGKVTKHAGFDPDKK